MAVLVLCQLVTILLICSSCLRKAVDQEMDFWQSESFHIHNIEHLIERFAEMYPKFTLLCMWAVDAVPPIGKSRDIVLVFYHTASAGMEKKLGSVNLHGD